MLDFICNQWKKIHKDSIHSAKGRGKPKGDSYSHYDHNPCGRDEARPSKISNNGCFQSWRDDLRGVRCSWVAIMRIAAR